MRVQPHAHTLARRRTSTRTGEWAASMLSTPARATCAGSHGSFDRPDCKLRARLDAALTATAGQLAQHSKAGLTLQNLSAYQMPQWPDFRAVLADQAATSYSVSCWLQVKLTCSGFSV